MKDIKKTLARLLGLLGCGLSHHQYQMRCRITDHYPWVRVIGWQCERCGKWA